MIEGAAEQWRHMRQKGDDLTRNVEIGLEMMSARVDEAVEESFPASDSAGRASP